MPQSSEIPDRSTGPTRRTQAERRHTARTAILETAIELLAGGGYANMTLADVGALAGYSRSLAAHYFGSKSRLLAAVVEHVLADSPPAGVIPEMRGLPRVQGEVAGLFRGLTSEPSRARAYIVIAHEAATSLPELRPIIHEQNVAFRQRVEAALLDGMDLGTVRGDVDPAAASVVIMAILRGVTWEWFTDHEVDLAYFEVAIAEQLRVLCGQPTLR